MTDLIATGSAPIPVTQTPITTRVATMADLPFLDALQKRHSKALGFFPRAQMEGYVSNQWVLLAVDAMTGAPLGYCASRDRYLKRDELGVVYQLCVAPGEQRKLVGASLVKAVFERSAYGCRLYCCWCAQDLDANYFWESLGFVPIAFRGGSGKKGPGGRPRVHIFWQRRIREGDATTPWWFPAKTDQGAMREDRLVLPIPPGKHWSEEMPVLQRAEGDLPRGEQDKAKRAARVRARLPKDAPPANGQRPIGARQFGGPSSAPPPPVEKPAPEKKPRTPRVKVNVDPKLVAAARELRDRYLERVNDDALALPASYGKYDVSRALPVAPAQPTPLLDAA